MLSVPPRDGGEIPVIEIQRLLAELGYSPGPADGVIGLGTRKAIKAFQKDSRFPVTGRANDVLLRRLRLAKRERGTAR